MQLFLFVVIYEFVLRAYFFLDRGSSVFYKLNGCIVQNNYKVDYLDLLELLVNRNRAAWIT